MAKKNEVNPGAVVDKPGSADSNKTGSWRTFKPVITDRCVACGICTWYCPDSAIEVRQVNGKRKAVVNYDYCKGCLICMNECPHDAIEKEMDK